MNNSGPRERTMTNWLEDEERNQAIERQSDLLQFKIRKQKEEQGFQRLGTLHALCGRVNGVRPDSLTIDRFTVHGPVRQIDTSHGYAEKLTGKRRWLRINCAQEETLIDAVITELFINGNSDGPYTGQRDIVVIRNACFLEDLSDWKEGDILQAIRWLLNETAAVKDSLPGREIMNAEARLVIHLSRRPYKDDPDSVQVVVDGKIVGAVSVYDRTNVGQDGRAFDLAVGGHQLTVNGGGSSRSVTIHLVAAQVTKYSVSFGWGGINLKPV